MQCDGLTEFDVKYVRIKYKYYLDLQYDFVSLGFTSIKRSNMAKESFFAIQVRNWNLWNIHIHKLNHELLFY